MNEYDIQNALWYNKMLLHHSHLCPNVYIYEWESDFVSVTTSGYAHEYEAKISVSDFRADAKKTEKHQILRNGWREPSEWESRYIEMARSNESVGLPHPYLKKLTPLNKIIGNRPNFFWYVCPENLIRPEDVPDYAGLIYIPLRCRQYQGCGADIRSISCVRSAPRLHREKISDHLTKKIVSSFGFKYWNLRMAKTELEEAKRPVQPHQYCDNRFCVNWDRDVCTLDHCHFVKA